MTRWIGAGLLAFLVIAGVFFAHRASAGGDESAAGDVESAHVRMPAATHSPGTQTDARAPEFGLIGDARMGDAGRMYLLDVMERRVGVSAGGDTIVWTGRIGRGPGEFFVPVALAAGADVLYVLDRGNQRSSSTARRMAGWSVRGAWRWSSIPRTWAFARAGSISWARTRGMRSTRSPRATER
jgi:hypothetical protein